METEESEWERKKRVTAAAEASSPPGPARRAPTSDELLARAQAAREGLPPAAPTPPPAPGAPAGPSSPALTAGSLGREQTFVKKLLMQPGKPIVDKYFGSKLPPVCRELGCYVTDDGKFFYCINPHCHKDRKRETKYNRRRKSLVYFFCPKCKSREIQLHLKSSNYECLECAYSWKH